MRARGAKLSRGALLGLAYALSVSAALAGEKEPPSAADEHGDDGDDEDVTQYWARQETRPFVSGQVALGPLSQLALYGGYGKPHYAWAGVETHALSSTEFGALHAALRADLLLVNLSVGARYTWAYARRFPTPRESFDEESLTDETRPRSRYPSLDVSLWGYVPAGPTLGYWEVDHYYLFDKSSEDAVFEEYVRFSINENSATMGRLVWYAKLLHGRLLAGPAADAVTSSGRDVLVRVGGSVNYQLTRHMGLTLYLSAPVKSPDDLTWFTQSWGIARLSWNFASGEPRPGSD